VLAFLYPSPLFALGEVYTWRDAAATRISNLPPPWYRLEGVVNGPRVIVTRNDRVIDDTNLSIEERRLLRPPLHGSIQAGRRMP
jgi:hypothetical protein